MATQTIGIIVNGATGRIGSTQHLANALVPIIAEDGLALGGDRLMPRLLLVGRDADRLAAVARMHGIADWSTDLDAALSDAAYAIFFDAAATQQRLAVLEKLAALTASGALGRVVGFRLEFGWWVFDGSEQPCQRPSWNYRPGGGGLILDMYPH